MNNIKCVNCRDVTFRERQEATLSGKYDGKCMGGFKLTFAIGFPQPKEFDCCCTVNHIYDWKEGFMWSV